MSAKKAGPTVDTATHLSWCKGTCPIDPGSGYVLHRAEIGTVGGVTVAVERDGDADGWRSPAYVTLVSYGERMRRRTHAEALTLLEEYAHDLAEAENRRSPWVPPWESS